MTDRGGGGARETLASRSEMLTDWQGLTGRTREWAADRAAGLGL